MKKTIIIFALTPLLFLMIGLQKANAQCVLTIPDLLKTHLLKADAFGAYLLNKGYSHTADKGDSKTYFCTIKRVNGTQDMASLDLTIADNPAISFFTTEEKAYLALINELAPNGFKFQYKSDVESAPKVFTTNYYYSDGKHQINYFSSASDGLTWYTWQLWNL